MRTPPPLPTFADVDVKVGGFTGQFLANQGYLAVKSIFFNFYTWKLSDLKVGNTFIKDILRIFKSFNNIFWVREEIIIIWDNMGMIIWGSPMKLQVGSPIKRVSDGSPMMMIFSWTQVFSVVLFHYIFQISSCLWKSSFQTVPNWEIIMAGLRARCLFS